MSSNCGGHVSMDVVKIPGVWAPTLQSWLLEITSCWPAGQIGAGAGEGEGLETPQGAAATYATRERRVDVLEKEGMVRGTRL